MVWLDCQTDKVKVPCTQVQPCLKALSMLSYFIKFEFDTNYGFLDIQ